MPTKDIEILSGTLYLNDKPIMKLDKCEIVEQEVDEFVIEEPKTLNIDWTREVTLTLENVKINRNALLSFVHGRKVTNNWLKQHGGIMTRKKGKKYGNTKNNII